MIERTTKSVKERINRMKLFRVRIVGARKKELIVKEIEVEEKDKTYTVVGNSDMWSKRIKKTDIGVFKSWEGVVCKSVEEGIEIIEKKGKQKIKSLKETIKIVEKANEENKKAIEDWRKENNV